MLPWLALTLPWIGLALFVALRVRLPPELPSAPADRPAPSDRPDRPPLVTVVVPARNEERDIRRVVDSVCRSTWPRFEVIVVDDRSTDGTGDAARAVDPGRAERVEVVDGEPLPEGWTGKPWACWQGARRARGDLLVFTDADTVHGPDLMARAVEALESEGADALTVVGRQLMESFWERLVQPQVFLNMVLRYFDTSRPVPPERWRSAIANGQYILFRAEVYRAMGGHEAVRDRVVEDQALAQILVRDGWRFRVRRAEDAFATRMYRSLGELVAGWSKNLVLGGLQTLPPALRRIAPPVMLATGVGLWLLPPLVLAAGLLGLAGEGPLAWAAATVVVSAAFWSSVTARMGAPGAYGLLYPLGAAVGSWIFVRSWLGMRRVRWKGRTYRAEPITE